MDEYYKKCCIALLITVICIITITIISGPIIESARSLQRYQRFDMAPQERMESCQCCLKQYAPSMKLYDSIPYYYYLQETNFNDPAMIVMKYKIGRECYENCTGSKSDNI